MDRALLVGAALTAASAFLAWTQVSRTAIVPCGLVAGILVGATGRPMDNGLLRGAKAGALGAVLFVTTIAVVGGYRYRVVSTGYAIDWSLFTWFSMSVMVLPLFTLEGGVAAPAAAWVRRFVARVRRQR